MITPRKKKEGESKYDMSDEIKIALKKQMLQELKNHFFYLRLSLYFNKRNLPGCCEFFKFHSNEEYKHYQKIYNYLLERQIYLSNKDTESEIFKDFKIVTQMPTISTKKNFTLKVKISHILDFTLELEIKNSENIYDIMLDARYYEDYHLEQFLKWFIVEQLEEEVLFDEINDTYKRMKKSRLALKEFDEYMKEKNKVIHLK